MSFLYCHLFYWKAQAVSVIRTIQFALQLMKLGLNSLSITAPHIFDHSMAIIARKQSSSILQMKDKFLLCSKTINWISSQIWPELHSYLFWFICCRQQYLYQCGKNSINSKFCYNSGCVFVLGSFLITIKETSVRATYNILIHTYILMPDVLLCILHVHWVGYFIM